MGKTNKLCPKITTTVLLLTVITKIDFPKIFSDVKDFPVLYCSDIRLRFAFLNLIFFVAFIPLWEGLSAVQWVGTQKLALKYFVLI